MMILLVEMQQEKKIVKTLWSNIKKKEKKKNLNPLIYK